LPVGVDESTVFRSIFQAYPDALLLVDARGAIVLASPAAAALLGYSVNELCALDVDQLVPEAVRSRHASYRAGYGQAPRARPMGMQMDLVAKRKDGSEVMVEIALSPLQDHGLPFVVASVRDISAYPRVKQALQRARYSEHLAQLGRLAVDSRDAQELLDRAPRTVAEALEVEVAMVFLRDSDPQCLRVASAVGPLPGEEVGARLPYRPETSLGLVLSQGVPVVVQDYRSEPRFVVPQAYLDAGLLSALAVPISDRGRTIGALLVRSRIAQRFGDDELRFMEALASLLATGLQRAQSEEALNHAQRLESVGQLTGGIAHDFNNLLTIIQGNLQLLDALPALAADGHGQQLVGAAARAARRGAELTGKLLAFSRRQVLQPSAVDLRALLHSLTDMLRRTMDPRIRIEVEVPPQLPPALADAGQLESALLNIAINARDAMPDGGTLRFRADAGRRLPAAVRDDLGDAGPGDDSYVVITIADDGAGMSDEVRERAFEPFFTTKEVGRGTGLGLSTVYGFVKQSKGAVTIDSAPGAGCTLTLYLPQPPQPAATADGPVRATLAVPEGLRVLLVEDDADVREVVQTFLRGFRCRVMVAANAEQALLVLDSVSDFDLLLTDIALGAGMRGTELAARAQQRSPRLAVLLMSGYSSELLDADRDAPASWELLRKPYTREELAQAIARLTAAR
jgi:PAS domain S-box-containing protein